MPDQFEERRIPETQFRADPEAGTFSGLASAFKSVDSYGTAFLRGAFRKTVADHSLPDGGSRIPAVWFHYPERMVGPVTSLKEGKDGLNFTAKAIDDGADGSMVLAHLRGGTPIGMSFSFRRIKDRSATEQDDIDLSTAEPGMKLADVRAITEVQVREISPLPWTFASNAKAVITDIRAADLPSLLDAIRADAVTDEQRTLLDHLVAEWTPRAAAGSRHSTPDQTTAHRNFDAEYGLLLMELGMIAA
jgi:HK97 family phage prohead protease